MSVLDVLQERGFIKQMSHEAEIKELLEKEKITFYICNANNNRNDFKYALELSF